MIATKTVIALLLIISISLAACGKKEPGEPAPLTESAADSAEEKPIDDNYPYKPEDYTQFKQEPRIQFGWRHPTHKKDSVWSIGLHGEDLRETISAEWLFMEEGGDVNRPITRSPDNRYVAVRMHLIKGFGSQRRLYDLKTHTMTVMSDGGSEPFFAWTPDSKAVLFYTDGDLWEYRVDRMQLRPRKKISSLGLTLVNDHIYAQKEDGYEVYSEAGELLQTFKWPGYANDYLRFVAVSPDEKLIAWLGSRQSQIAAMPGVEPPILSFSGGLIDGTFLDSKSFVYEDVAFKQLDIPSGAVSDLFHFKTTQVFFGSSVINVRK